MSETVEAQGVEEPLGELAIRTLAMPKDTNPAGDIFGGWLLSQMDVAGGITAGFRAKGRVATVAVTGMEFHKPVWVGDVVCCYGHIERVGRTSLTIRVQAWVLRERTEMERIKVTEGVFTFVAIDDDGKPRPVPPE
jgi:acyl-CoA thioesterase YciA